jgi:hypothetical protein
VVEPVAERLADLAALGHGREALLEPGLQCLDDGLGAVLARTPAQLGRQPARLVLDRVEILDARQRLSGDQEVDQMREELSQAKGDAKNKLEAKIASTQAALKTAEDRAKARIVAVNKTIDSKIQALKEHASKSTGEAKARLEQQIAQIKADRDSRAAKLHQAWQLTKEALRISPQH